MSTPPELSYVTITRGDETPESQKCLHTDALWAGVIGLIIVPIPMIEYLLVFVFTHGLITALPMAITHAITISLAAIAAFLGFRGLRRIAAQPSVFKGRGLAHTGIICAACVVAQFLVPQLLITLRIMR